MHRALDAQCRLFGARAPEEGDRAGDPHAVFAERDPDLVRELYHLACEMVSCFCLKAAELLEEAETDALAYLDFPYAHHRRLRTNNVQERANREPKHRSRVVQVFPSRKSLIRMLGAVFSEMDEGWAARRWFTEESITQAVGRTKVNAPEPAYDGTAEEHARASSMSWSPTTRLQGGPLRRWVRIRARF